MSKFFFFKPHFSRYSLSSPLKSTIPGSHLRGTGACLKHPPTPRVVPSLGQPSPQGACPTCCRPTTLAPSGLDPHAGCCLCFSPLPSPPLNPPPPHPAEFSRFLEGNLFLQSLLSVESVRPHLASPAQNLTPWTSLILSCLVYLLSRSGPGLVPSS